MSGTGLDHDHGDVPNPGWHRHRDADLKQRLIADLIEHGYAVVDGFLGVGAARALYEFEKVAWSRGDFRVAGVSRSAERTEEQRRDFIRWLGDDEKLRAPHGAFFAALDNLRVPLREHLHLPLGEQEFHASVYPPKAFYRRHVDTFADTRPGPRRLLSLVYYFNPAWRPEDGGEIVLWPREDEAPRQLSPAEDRLVVFWSAKVPHEVRAPVARERLALTGWWLSR